MIIIIIINITIMIMIIIFVVVVPLLWHVVMLINPSVSYYFAVLVGVHWYPAVTEYRFIFSSQFYKLSH